MRSGLVVAAETQNVKKQGAVCLGRLGSEMLRVLSPGFCQFLHSVTMYMLC